MESEEIQSIIDGNSADICKLIEGKSMKPLEIRPESSTFEPNTADWYLFQGYTLRCKGDTDSAITQYRIGLRRDENHTGLKVNLGVCFMKIGLVSKALEMFQDVSSYQAYINSAICYIVLHEYSSAVDCIELALKIHKSDAFCQLLALALFRSGRVTHALEVFKDVSPDEALIEDERNLRVQKDPKVLFPFKIGEIGKFLCENRKSQRRSRSFAQTSAESTSRSSKHAKYSYVQSKIDDKPTKPPPKILEFQYQPKLKPALPDYSHIISKKNELDKIIRKRHSTLSDIMQKNVPGWKEEDFVQQKLETAPISFYQALHSNGERDKKLQKVKKEIESVKTLVEFKENLNADDIVKKRLTEQTLRFVQEEFAKPREFRNYGDLEEVLKKIPFFSKFPSEIREKLLKCAVLKQYSPEDVIIKQGDPGDSMFVILSGSIKIQKKSPEFGNHKIVVNSMYEGDTFGELALLSEGMDENIKRSATCKSCDNTILLGISKEDYKSILLYEMQNDIMAKVNFFKSLTVFEDLSGISLIPLASNIEFFTYKIDERIIQAGEKPKGLYMIYKGRCNLYWEGYVAVPVMPSAQSNIKIRPKTPKPYFTGKIVPNQGIRRKSTRKSTEITAKELQEAKKYLPADIAGKYIRKDRILCKPLKESDYFGGRALIDGTLDTSSDKAFKKQAHFALVEAKPAKFTVVAESTEVKIFILTKKHFPLLSEEIVVRGI